MFTSRPADLQALHQLSLEIQSKQSPIYLGEKSLAAFSSLLMHPENTALLSITELANQLQISASTLTRLVKRLGFTGFADFQQLFKNTLSSHSFYSTQATKLIHPVIADPAVEVDPAVRVDLVHDNPSYQRLAQLATENIQNIQQFMQSLSCTQLVAAAQAIAHAKRVRIHGMRQYSALSQFLNYGLGLIRTDVAQLDNYSQGMAEGLAQLEAGDVLISASVFPYTRDVVSVSKQAVTAGLTLITLSDHSLSPLSKIAHHAFLIPCHSSFYSNSISAYFVFAEGLLNQVAWELGDDAIHALARREHFISALDIETN